MNWKTYILSGILMVVSGCKPNPEEVHIGTISSIKSSVEKEIHISNQFGESDTTHVNLLIAKANSISRQFPDSAASLYFEALNVSQQIQYNLGITISLLNIGNYFSNFKADYPSARHFYSMAVPYSKLSGHRNKKTLPGAYISIGSTYFYEGNRDSAIHFYYLALNILKSRKTTDTGQLKSVYMNIGATFEDIDQDYDRAFQYLWRAERLASYTNDSISLSYIYKNIGVLHSRKSNHDSALWFYNKVLQFVNDTFDKQIIQDVYGLMAGTMLLKGNYKKARAYFDSAISADEESAWRNPILIHNMGYAYFCTGDFEKAIQHYEKALVLYNEKRRKGYDKLNSYATLAKLYDTIGRGHLAYQYQKKFSELKDSILNEDKIKALNQLEIQYRTSEKDRDIIKKQAQSQRKSAAIWIAVLCILLLLSILFFLRHTHLSKLRRLRQQKELDLLKATMEGEEAERLRVGQELHDGVSGLLSAIKMNLVTLRLQRKDIAGERNFITTMELADEAADELRKTAHNLVPSSLINNGITKAIRGFCDRVNTSLDIHIDVYESGRPLRPEAAKELAIYRIIQELIHNMIKHSNATKGMVSFSWQKNLLLITVEDNGIGITVPEGQEGIGLENIQKRMKALNGLMEINHVKDEGTSIYLEFPLSVDHGLNGFKDSTDERLGG